ncbi:MAG: hypothetical protein ACOVOR_05355 [Rhabdochlamydiaceae bacterium]
MLNNVSNYFSNFNRAENYISRKECLVKLKPAISFVSMTGLTTGALLAFCIYKGKDVQIFPSSVNQFINKNIVFIKNSSLVLGGLCFFSFFLTRNQKLTPFMDDLNKIDKNLDVLSRNQKLTPFMDDLNKIDKNLDVLLSKAPKEDIKKIKSDLQPDLITSDQDGKDYFFLDVISYAVYHKNYENLDRSQSVRVIKLLKYLSTEDSVYKEEYKSSILHEDRKMVRFLKKFQVIGSNDFVLKNISHDEIEEIICLLSI